MAVTLTSLFAFRRLLINSTACSRAYLSGFKSSISLDKLYPSSRLDITTIPKPPETKNGQFSGFIPMDKIEISYARSSGPGGQNVNSVSTKAEIRFHLASAEWISKPIREKLAEQMRNYISKEGYLIVKSDRTRSQHLNLADSLDKLRNIIYSAAQSLVVPEVAPETVERHRRLRERAARERLREKRAHSMTKQGRQAPNLDS